MNRIILVTSVTKETEDGQRGRIMPIIAQF